MIQRIMCYYKVKKIILGDLGLRRGLKQGTKMRGTHSNIYNIIPRSVVILVNKVLLKTPFFNSYPLVTII